MGDAVETIQLESGHSVVAFGAGERTLLLLPSLADALFDVFAWSHTLALMFRAYGQRYRVVAISRPRDLPEDITISAMADGYAAAYPLLVEHGVMGQQLPVVMGISMGGLIAQALALRHPAMVGGLVLAISGCRFSEEGQAVVRQMMARAEADDWAGLYRLTMDEGVVAGKRFLYDRLSSPQASATIRAPAYPQDFIRSARASLHHDTTEQLHHVSCLALVVGGDRDIFFSQEIMRQTADAMPRGQQVVMAGYGHGVMQEAKAAFHGAVLDFLGSLGCDGKRML